MKHYIYFSILSIYIIVNGCSTNRTNFSSDLYFNTEAPQTKPVIFAEGVISNGFHEHSIVISPDGDNLFYVINDKNYSLFRIVHQKRINSKWQDPEIAHFSSDYSDLSPVFSADASKLLFISKRPLPGEREPGGKYRLWYVEKTDNGYGKAQHLSLPLSNEDNIANPFMTANGDIYFQYSQNNGNWEIYQSRYKDGFYGKPEPLSENINTQYNECAPYLSPQNDYLLFHSNRPGGFGRNDIYISFRKSDDTWAKPVNLGSQINTSFGEWRPTLSPDGKYLFFSSFKSFSSDDFKSKPYQELKELYSNPLNGSGTLFWVKADFLNELKAH